MRSLSCNNAATNALKPSFDLCLTIRAESWFIHSQRPSSVGPKNIGRVIFWHIQFPLKFHLDIFYVWHQSFDTNKYFGAKEYVPSKIWPEKTWSWTESSHFWNRCDFLISLWWWSFLPLLRFIKTRGVPSKKGVGWEALPFGDVQFLHMGLDT